MTVTVFRYIGGKMRSSPATRRPRSGKLSIAKPYELGLHRHEDRRPLSLKELAKVGVFLTRVGAIQAAIERYDRVAKHYEEQLREVAADRGQALRDLNAEERRMGRLTRIGEAS